MTLLNTIACPNSKCGASLPNGLSNGRGLTVDPAGNVWVANSTAGQILKFPAGSQTPVVFTTTNTCSPVGTAIDGEGNVFYTCNGESNIYELVGGKGTGVAIPISYGGTNYSTDDHLSVDAAGNLYPTSYQPASNLFFKVDATTHAVSVIGTAPAGARFVGAVTDAAGNTFAPDYNNGILYELRAGASTLTTLYNLGSTTAPHAIAEDASGSLYVTTTIPGTTGGGTSNLLRFSSGSYTSTPASISVPGGDSLWITPDGNFYTIYANATLAVYSRSVFSLAFPNTAVGQTSAAQSVTLENDGTAPLTISPPTSGTNPSISTNFSFDPSSTCPRLSSGSALIVLAAGGSCIDVMEFTPLQAGTISGSLVTTDNSANVAGSTQTINISGNATQGTPTVTVPNASGTLGQSATLTATVNGGGTSPTGAVTFVVGSGSSVTGTCTSASGTESCTASYPTTGLSAGSNTITVSYAGDVNYLAQTGTGTLTLAAAPTITTVTSSLNPSTFGASVTFTGKVTSGIGTPSGSVTFLDGTVTLGTGTLNASGVATFSTSVLSVSTHSITVAYAASGNFAASTSTALGQTVAKATAYSNALSTSNASPSFGTSVTFTDTLATLAGVAPTGMVTFYNNGTIIGTGTPDSTGVASFTTSNLPVGSDRITALYGGDGNYASTSAALTETVSKATGYPNTLTSSNLSPMFGSSVTLTDTLPILGGVAPTGTVTFYNGTTSIGTGTLTAGVVTITTSALPVGTDTISASYVGDFNYNGSTSNNLPETVTKASGYSDVLATSNANPTFGSSVKFTATLGSAAGVYPTGSVNFLNGTTSLGTGTISATGVATINTSSLPVGSDSVTAQYAGDGNFAAATSNAVAETVAKATVSSDVLTTSNANPAFGSSVVLTDTLAPINGVYPTGTVNFLNGTVSLGTGTVGANGIATLTTGALPVGADTITAQYAGDTNFNGITSTPLTETVTKATITSDVLTTSNATPGYGSSVTLTDTIAAVNGNLPTGTVTFMNGTVTLGTGTVNAAGVATFATTNLPVGTDTITAQYGGDTNFNTAASNSLTETVAKATGYGNVLTTSNASPTFGTGITLTVTIAAVNGTYPTGSVTFLNGTTSIGTGTLSATGVATLNISSLPVGTDTIKVSYLGDNTFAASNSNTLNETVAKANVPSNVLTTSNASPAYGGSVTLTDTLGALGGNYPSGTVNFFNGATQIGTGTLSATGVATFTTTSLPVGTDTVTAQYAGDNNFNSSNSNSLGETVAKATGYGDVLSTSNAAPTFGGSVTLTDTIAAVNGTYATGSVTFLNGTTSLGTGTISATGVATLTTSALPSGPNSVTASYAGDTTFAAATSNAVTETVGKATVASDVLSTSNANPGYGTSVTLTDTFPAVNGTYPTGTITFLNGTTSIGTGTLASGVATLTTTNLPVGTDSITAQFAGDTNFTAATSNALAETVAKASGYGNALTSSNLNPTFGTGVTLTDTIAAVNGTNATGIVTFFNGATQIGTGTLTAGVATISTSALPVGADAIKAVYLGDSTFGGSNSNILTENVAKANVPSNVLTTSNASPAYGGSVTLTDTLGALGGNYPSGTVIFLNGTTSIGTGTLSGTGVATLTLTTLPVGADSITVQYGGDTNFSTSTSNAITETVAKATGYGDALTTSNATPTFGTSITLTDTIAAVNGTYPTGSVTFYNGGTSLGTGTISATGVATLATGALPSGADTVTAQYAGDANFGPATSNAVTETVGKATLASDVLSTSNASPSYGTTITLTDTLPAVNGSYPSGTITFLSGGASIGTAILNGSGVATLSTSNLPVGTDSIIAQFAGDGNFTAATSNALPVNVGKATGYNNLLTSSNLNPSYSGNVTFTDTLGSVNGVFPTGTVTFLNGTTSIGTGTLNASGVATLTTGTLPVGADTITAQYIGDATFTSSTSNAVNETVAKADVASDVLTTSNASPSFGGSVILTDTFGATNGVFPTGTVTFNSGSTLLGTGAINASGVATLTTTALLPGTDTVTAVYGGSATLNTATSNAVTETVAKATGSNTLTTSNASPMFGTSVTFTSTLSSVNGVTPTGTVTFSDGSTALGTGTVNSSGVATFSTATLPVGSNTITASYGGDTSYAVAPSNTIQESVAKASGYSDVLSASTTSPTFGQSVTLTDTLPSVNGVAPTGTVTFSNGTTTLGTGTLNNGVATLTTSTLPTGADSVSATYSGDNNFSNASSNSLTITVGKVAATSNDTVTGSGTFGAATTPVTVTIPYAGTVAPTGAITVTDTTRNNTLTLQASTCTASNSNLVCTGNLPTANLAAGSNPVTVSEAGDTNFSGSTGTGSITLSKAGLTTGDTATGTGTYGATTTTVTVSIPYSGPAAPTGSITVTDSLGNTVAIAASTCTASATALTCSANLPTASEPVGANTVNVSQAGDANYSGSTGTGTMTIGKAPATSTDTATGTGSYGADTSSITVKIPFAGTKAPTGDITVADSLNNTVIIKAASCSTAGQTLTCTANLHTANEPLGSNALTITQAGDTNYTGSTGTGSVTIGPAVASTGDTATGTGTYGSSPTTVKVSIPYAGGSAPTGAITLSDTHGNTVTIQASSCTPASGALNCTALLNTANEPVGGNLVQVSQVADADYAGSSGSGTITISKAPVTANDSADGAGYYGSPTTAVNITIPYAGVAAPTGAITLKDTIGNTVSVAASSCAASGYALACTVNLPTANEPEGGTNPLTVSQVGDSNYSGSTGTGNVIIGKTKVTATDTASGTGTYGDATTPVIVTIPYAGVAGPTGAITVSDSFGNKAFVGAATCVSSGGALTCTASLPTANEPTGSNPVTINQTYDNNYAGSTGSGTVTINPAGAHGNNSATGSGSYGAPSTPITIVIPFSGSTSPTGAITVSDVVGNTVTIPAANCKASANALVCPATLATANEPLGANVVSVVQAADANYASSTGSGTIAINQAPVTTNDTAIGAGNYGSATTAVTVTIPYAGVAAPSGAVTVTDSLGNTVSSPASACTSAGQTLTCTLYLPTANEPLGTNQVTVAQAADANYAGSTGSGNVTISTSPVSPVGSTASGVQNVTITQGTVSTLLTASLAYGGAIPPSGAVTFTVAGGAPVTANCSTGASPEVCTATYPTDSLQVGTYTITSTEAADPNYTAGSATGTLTVAAGSVSPILDSISYVGNVLIIAGTQSATLTANITYTGPVPTGALTFNLPGGTPVTATCTSGPSPLACTAAYPTASLAPATYVITALEAADSNYPQGEATALLTVSPSASTPVSPILATGSYVNSVLVPYGTSSATLYATIVFNGPAPTGAVTFSVIGGSGAAVQGVCTSGSSPMTCTADYPTATLGIGGYKIQVNVAADNNYPAGSAIGTLTVSEVAASTNDAVTGTGNYGDPSTPITVSIPYPGSIAPTGAITVTDSYTNTVTVQASVCTASGGTLSCPANLPTANVPLGADAATVSQGPDTVYASSTGKGSITIGKALATTTDTATGTGTFGAATTPVTVTIPYAGTTAPSGAITVSDGFTNTATIPAASCTAASGTLTCTANLATANEPLGTNALTLTQVGDSNYTGSTGTGTVTIGKAGATNGDTATGTGTYGAASTPVIVTIPYVGSTAPTGAITVADTHNNTVTTPAAACTTTSSTITCTVTLPTATEPTGPNTVNVSQAGDSNYAGSTGTGTVTINKAPATSSDTTSGTGYLRRRNDLRHRHHPLRGCSASLRLHHRHRQPQQHRYGPRHRLHCSCWRAHLHGEPAHSQ